MAYGSFLHWRTLLSFSIPLARLALDPSNPSIRVIGKLYPRDARITATLFLIVSGGSQYLPRRSYRQEGEDSKYAYTTCGSRDYGFMKSFLTGLVSMQLRPWLHEALHKTVIPTPASRICTYSHDSKSSHLQDPNSVIVGHVVSNTRTMGSGMVVRFSLLFSRSWTKLL